MLYLLDSSAVLNDFGFEFTKGNSYVTTPLVMGEFRDMRSRHLAENALQAGLLRLEEPGPKTISYVEETVLGKGFTRLSKPDISLIALGLDLKKQGRKFILVTDDYSVQNFCSLLEIPFQDAMRGKIRGQISFSLLCEACGKNFPVGSKARKCPDCGSGLKRKRLPESQNRAKN